MSIRPTVIVHGGAGKWPRARQPRGLSGVRKAAAAGFDRIRRGSNAIDAVEAAVVSMEDNPTFNAGTGSTFNLLGENEMDAAIVDGTSREAGAVALVRGIRNPICLARLIMEKTNHVLVAGYGAERIAASFGLPTADVMIPERKEAWRRALRRVKSPMTQTSRNWKLAKSMFPFDLGDTVGALALDKFGNIAAGCSTGGMLLKLPGRIGDSAILGAGLYADTRYGAATATGVGEIAIRSVLSKIAVEFMTTMGAKESGLKSLGCAIRDIGAGTGLLTLDKTGGFGVTHDTPHLCWASASKGSVKWNMTGTRVRASQLGRLLRG